MRLYKLVIGMRRSADLTEVAVASDEDWRAIQAHAGADLYFGEVAGKHSEVSWELDPAALEVLTENEAEIALFRRWFPEGRIGQVSVLGAIERLHDQIVESADEGDGDGTCHHCGWSEGVAA